MGFAEAIRTCLGKYVDFSGRARRSEYWFFQLFVALVIIVPVVLAFLTGIIGAQGMYILALLWGLAVLALLLPILAVSVRRLHDTNSSGWWYLISFVPYIGGFIMLVWYWQRGTAGENRFGPDPLDPSGARSGTFD
jgi:uncharacterized membrane protein YhaH (DUF805 family)